MRSNLNRAQLLIAAVHEFSSAPHFGRIVDVATRIARVGSQADGVSFVVREEEQCHYVNEDAIGPLWKGQRFPMATCVSGWAMNHGLPVVIPDIALDERVPQAAYSTTFVRSLVMVPIRTVGPIGAIGAYWEKPHAPPAETVHWLQVLADAASAGVAALRGKEESTAVVRAPLSVTLGEDAVRMCAWTKRVWFNHEWLSIEAYLSARFGLSVTHGMCPEVRERLLKEIK